MNGVNWGMLKSSYTEARTVIPLCVCGCVHTCSVGESQDAEMSVSGQPSRHMYGSVRTWFGEI